MSETKPKLNNARIHPQGAYRALYDIKEVDAEQQIWKGRLVPIPALKGVPGMVDAVQTGWVFFSRRYDPAFEWDNAYPEIKFDDPEIIGQPFILVHKDKCLFGYEPSTTIVRPPAGVNFGKRR